MESTTVRSTKTKWYLDTAHSSLEFKVRHMMITNVKGEFKKFAASLISTSADFSHASIDVVIDAGSIFTREEKRDGHLRSVEFLDVAKYPMITFRGKSSKEGNDHAYKLQGILTIRNVTREIELDVEFGGINTDRWGNEKAGFTVMGSINRKDYGLNWNTALETGGVLVGDEIKFTAEVQFVKQV